MAGLGRRLVAFLAAAALAVPAAACPFCSMQGTTLTGELGQASLVFYGRLANADTDKDTTDLVVDAALKAPADLDPSKPVKLARAIPTPKDDKFRYLVFCDEFKGKIDPYRILQVEKDADVARYLRGAVAHKDRKIGDRLRYFFDYLDNADPEIANDAYKEFANASYTDYKDMARGLPADRIAGWLSDERTPAYRFGLYASMLGHCGNRKHAELLHSLLENPVRRAGSGVDGMLAGYVMLEPKDGWAYIQGILGDAHKEFLLRYAALRAVRFLYDYQPVKIDRKELVEGVAKLLSQGDVADLAIDDLRKWGCWDMTDRVLALRNGPNFEVPIIRRAVLRFCLSAKGNAAAEKFVTEQRKKDPQGVADVEELLKLEQQTPALPTAAPGK
jgi:hypothetical protein